MLKNKDAKPYLSSLTIRGFRGFKNLYLKNLSRVNLVGGLNGTGKTSLLESIFLVLDRKNLGSIIRPSQFRGMPFDFKQSVQDLFFNRDLQQKIVWTIDDRNGRAELTWKFGYVKQPPASTFQLPTAPQQPVQSLVGDSEGITSQYTADRVVRDTYYISGQRETLTGWMELNNSSAPPLGALLTPSLRYDNAENARRFTAMIQQNEKERLLSVLRILHPQIADLELLVVGGQALLHATLATNIRLPLNDLGDGTYLLGTIALAMMTNRNGVVMLDEFDTAIHYSKLSKIWRAIAELAAQFNCQIVATTHSRECIQCAVEGFAETDHRDDLQFLRLDRLGEKTEATTYDPKELASAIDAKFEVR